MCEPQPILPYAKSDAGGDFRVDDSVIYIHSSNGRLHRHVCWTIAASLLVLPLLIPRTQLELNQPFGFWLGCVVYALTVAFLVCAGWWWSDATLDTRAGLATLETRWGPIRRRRTVPFDDFYEVVVESDSDGDWTVDLLGGSRWTVAWGRNGAETVRIGRAVAERLQLPLRGGNRE